MTLPYMCADTHTLPTYNSERAFPVFGWVTGDVCLPISAQVCLPEPVMSPLLSDKDLTIWHLRAHKWRQAASVL